MININENIMYYRFIIPYYLIIKNRFWVIIYNYYYVLKNNNDDFEIIFINKRIDVLRI